MCANYYPPRPDQFSWPDLPPPDFPFSEAYPGSTAPALTNFDPKLWVPACFGLVPTWAKDVKIARQTYNARSETVAEKPSYRTAWKQRHLCVIPAECVFEPNYESGKPVRWRIERADGKPFGIAGIWERRIKDDGLPTWSMSILTINADAHPLMRRFHKPGDEKRSVVVLDDGDWPGWLGAQSEADVRSFLQLFDPEIMVASSAPKATKSKALEWDRE